MYEALLDCLFLSIDRETKGRAKKSEAPEEGLEPSTTRLRALRSTD